MSKPAIALRKIKKAVARHKLIVGVAAAVGIGAGTLLAFLNPPMFASNALVVLAQQQGVRNLGAQLAIAKSDWVLDGAKRQLSFPLTLDTLRNRVNATAVTKRVVKITATGRTEEQAERTANAVAISYVDVLGQGKFPGRTSRAAVLDRASVASGPPMYMNLIRTSGLGLLAGLFLSGLLILVVRWPRQQVA